MHKSLITPAEVEQLAEQLLGQLHGQTYVLAMYALEIARQRLSQELQVLTDQHVFSPCPAQCASPKGHL